LENLESPNQSLHDAVDESYYAFRERLSEKTGWDYLSVLEDTFKPLTSPLEPGMQEDWLYTGRGLRTNFAPFDAGWLVSVREEYGSHIYWRLYLKARFQDGSQGAPLKQIPWDFSARQSGNPLSYMRGGALFEELPEGYWIDLTAYARAFGWYRQPSLPTWRFAYSAIQHNAFYHPDGLDWFSAMLEIYPREALNTPTPVSSPTASATPTETSTPTETPTRTPYLSPTTTGTPTLRPTNTPFSSSTITPTHTTPQSMPQESLIPTTSEP
jgi:TolB protein